MTEMSKVLKYQTDILDTLGNLMHHDAITGTSPAKVVADF
jgi:hypothetical protein